MDTKAFILSRLNTLSIPYTHYEHAATPTLEDCLQLPFAAPDVMFCKNIFLCNRQRTTFYLYVTLPDKPFRTAKTSKALGSSRLSFAPAECLPAMLHLKTGSLSPLGLWFDEDNTIQLALDREICRKERIAFHPCDNTATVIFTREAFLTQVLPSLRHPPLWL